MCLTCSRCKRSSLVVIAFARTWRAESHIQSSPLREDQELSLQAKTEDRFDADPVQAPGRAGVPGPSAAPDVRSDRIDIGGDGVGLDLVALHVCSRARAVDRIHEREQL